MKTSNPDRSQCKKRSLTQSIALAFLLSISLTQVVLASDQQAPSQTTQEVINLAELKAKLEQLDSQIQNSEAKLNAIESLKQYSRKFKASSTGGSSLQGSAQHKLEQANLDESANLFRHTIQQLADFDHVSDPRTGRLLSSSLNQQDVHSFGSRDPLLNQIIDRGYVKSDSQIVSFEVMPIKMFRSQYNAFINTIVAVATNKNLLSLYDMNGNILDQITLESSQQIAQIVQPYSQDDMSITCLTTDHNILQFKLKIQDYFGDSQQSPTQNNSSSTDSNTTQNGNSKTKKSKKTTNNPKDQPVALHQVLKITLEKKANLVELIEKANHTVDASTIDFKSLLFSRQRGRLLLTILDNTNHLTTLTSELNFHSRYLIDVVGTDEIKGLRKQQLSIMFFTNSKIGFTKITEKTIAPAFCDTGIHQITNIVVDQQYPGIIYAATQRGEIHIFEASSVSGKSQESMDCKPKGRLQTKLSFSQGVNDKVSIKLESANNLLYAYLPDGSLQIYKTADVDKLIKSEYKGVVFTLPHQRILGESQINDKLYMSVSGNFIAIQNPSTSSLTLIESTYNQKMDSASGSSGSSSWDANTVRYLLIIGAVAIVAGYQYVMYQNSKNAESSYKKDLAAKRAGAPIGKNSGATGARRPVSNQDESDEDGQGESIPAGQESNSDQLAQMKKMLDEMENLKKQTQSMSGALGAMNSTINSKDKKKGNPSNSRRPNNELIAENSQEDDDY
eukprot:403367791